MPNHKPPVNDKRTGDHVSQGDRRFLNTRGHLTPAQFLEFWTACHDIGIADAAYLFGYAVWDCGNEIFVFVGEGPDE